MRQKPSATTVIFPFWVFQSLQRTGVFNVPSVSTISLEKNLSSSGFFLWPLCLHAIKHYFLGRWHIYVSAATTRIREQMAIRISSFYRHVLQYNWWCSKSFRHRNIIIVRRVVFRIKLFIIVYIINVLILRFYVLLCVLRIFYIIDAIILTRISCIT